MEPVRAVPLAVVALVVVGAVATGPLGPLTIPAAFADDRAPGTGNATIAVTDPPGEPRFAPGRQGEDVYYLRVPDAEIEVRELRGNPTLVYTVGIEEFGYSRSSVHFLGATGPGRLSVSLESDPFDGTRIGEDAYDATLAIRLHANGTARQVYRTETTARVDR
jgi:hypothetical protein